MRVIADGLIAARAAMRIETSRRRSFVGPHYESHRRSGGDAD